MNIETKNTNQHLVDFQSNLEASKSFGTGAPVNPEAEAEYIRNTDTGDLIRQVTRQIDKLQGSLSETRGFDPRTGAPRYAVADELRRRGMEVELHHLQHSVLPYTHAQAAEINAKKAALPTQEQVLQAEGERRQRLALAAQKRAEEIEVEDMARRILAGRRHAGAA